MVKPFQVADAGWVEMPTLFYWYSAILECVGAGLQCTCQLTLRRTLVLQKYGSAMGISCRQSFQYKAIKAIPYPVCFSLRGADLCIPAWYLSKMMSLIGLLYTLLST